MAAESQKETIHFTACRVENCAFFRTILPIDKNDDIGSTLVVVPDARNGSLVVFVHFILFLSFYSEKQVLQISLVSFIR